MDTVDLNVLSVDELRRLLTAIPSEILKREALEKKSLLDELKELAKSRGFSLQDLMATNSEKPVKFTVAPKYKNPNNPEQTWTGRGRKPLWVVELLATGKSIEDLLI